MESMFVFYHDCPGGAEGVDMPRLADLRVFEPYRRQGAGRALLEAGEALAQTVCDRVFLTVGPGEAQTYVQQLYTNRGYVPFGEEGDSLVMVKELAQ